MTMNGRSTAAPRTAPDWRAGGSVLLATTLLLAACAGAPPSAPEDAAEAVGTGAASGIDGTGASSAPALAGNAPDGEQEKSAVAPLEPPLFTPVQAVAELTAAADRAAEPVAAEASSPSSPGGPSIRFKKPFAERGLPGEGEEVDRGTASWYGLQFHGRLTANGERYDMYDLTAAHKTLPFNTIVSVHNLQTGRSVRVRINDRGPFVDGRVIDLSKAAAEQLGMAEIGLRPVSLIVEEWPTQIAGARDPKRQASRSKAKPQPAPTIEGP